MKNCFVFCIGGTGLRVMKSALMMMSAGMDTAGYTIVPIVIDPHVELNERRNLFSLISDYKAIFNETWKDVNPSCGFFSSDVKTLKEVAGDSSAQHVSNEEHRTFGEFINIAKLPIDDSNHYLTECLFSEKNLNSGLDVGFKGSPNVGTVVLGEQFDSMGEIKSFKNIVGDDDRIFVISSIFGGTGASGAPLIQKIIKEDDSFPKLKNAVLGNVSVLPYFALGDPRKNHSDIDSSSFLTKARAALSYYSDHLHSDYLYYVGERTLRGVYENDETTQANPAHFIEMTAATSLFHFLHCAVPSDRSKTTTFMRTIKEDKDVLDLSSLGGSFAEEVKVIADGYLLSLLIKGLPEEMWLPLRVTRKFDSTFYSDSEFAKLKAWFECFELWRQQLKEKSDRALSPLNTIDKKKLLSENLKNLIENNPMEKMSDISCLYLEMLNASRSDKEEKRSKLGRFLNYAFQSIDGFTNKIIKS
ncbi:MAG: hypothetical protein K5867_04560 [Bacteroidales bacterium]|nr:hypothetical protein [Bacteroidales bacterium]